VATRRTGFPLILTAPITGGGNRPNSTGVTAHLDGDRSQNDKLNQWFNVNAFTLPAPFTFGNVSRTLPDVRGPSVANFDTSLSKATAITERFKLQLRFETFNTMNTPFLWLPNTTFGSPQFGKINVTTLQPRVFQLAAKLLF
jgi:hypothetical protein